MNAKGFSLIEIVMVVMIAGLIVLMLGNLPSSVKLIGGSRYESIAKEIATKKIEDLRSQTYTNLANGTNVLIDDRLKFLPSSSAEYTIGDCPETLCINNENVKQVDIKVSWSDAGKSKDVQVSTLISEGGLK